MPFFNHAGDDCFGADKWRDQVNINDLCKIIDRHVSHRNALDDARVIDQNIDHADFFFDSGNQLGYSFLIRHIGNITVYVDSFFFICLQAAQPAGFIGTVKANRRTGLRKADADGKANRVCAAGDQRDFPGKIKQIHLCSLISNPLFR